jgi:class 3 adenylate cyclase
LNHAAIEDFERSRRSSMVNDTGAAAEDASNAAGLEALSALSEVSLRDGTYLAPDGVVTILFSDMADSSLMFERMGDLRAQAIVRLHNEIIREQVALHKGAEVKTTGDGFMIAFSSARRALQCAIAIQRALAAYCAENSSDPICVKMGLHAGEAIRESNDFFGKAVILASRIADLARAGEILVSSTLRDLTESAGDLHFAEVQKVELKGFSGTYQICRAIWEPD